MTLIKANQRFFDVQDELLEALPKIEGYEDMPLLSVKLSMENLERMIPKGVQYASIATERCISSENGLTQDESAAIYLYTMDWKPYNQSLPARLNCTLRSKDRSKIFPYFFYLKLFSSALSKLESVKKTIWRGVKADLSERYPVGTTIVWWGFSSCIESFDQLQSEKFIGKTGIRTIFEIECESGKAINKHSHCNNINEILLLHGIHLKVINQTHFDDGLCIIHMKEITSSDFCLPSFKSSSAPNVSIKQNGNIDNSVEHTSEKQNKNNTSSPPTISIKSKQNNKLPVPAISTKPNENTISTRSVPNVSEVHTKEPVKVSKSYENKILKELINKERKSESIRFPTQSLNYDDMEIISDALESNNYWKTMFLWENYLNEKHMTILIHGLKINSTLMALNLDENLLKDEGTSILVSGLKTNTCLRTIYLNRNQIRNKGAQALGNMLYTNRTLTHLELSSNEIDDMGVIAISNALKENEYLKTLCLNGNKISEIGAQHLAEMLQINKTLIDLQVSSNPLSDNGVQAIAHALQQNTTLESLHIGETMITIDSMHDIGKMLEINSTLKCLNINNNNLGDEASLIIIYALIRNPILITLDLSMNNLTDRSISELGCLLQHKDTNLTNLLIGHNPLGDNGIKSLSSVLMKNTSLTRLMIESIGVRIKGVRELSIMLCFNKDLHYLSLSNNQLTANSINLLADALQYNKTLKYLYLNNCNLKDDCIPLIANIIKQSKTLISIELVKNHLTDQGKLIINEAAELNKTCAVYMDFTFQKLD